MTIAMCVMIVWYQLDTHKLASDVPPVRNVPEEISKEFLDLLMHTSYPMKGLYPVFEPDVCE